MTDKHDAVFTLDIPAIRKRARASMGDGAVTPGYRGDRETILRLLDESLATELVCVLRYRRHHFMSSALGGIAGFAVTGEFLDHAVQEQAHADRIAERIVQLGGRPDFAPNGLIARSHTPYVEADDLAGMIREDLVAERIAVEAYRAIITYLGDKDPTTRRMFESILEQEEEHADDMADLLRRVSL